MKKSKVSCAAIFVWRFNWVKSDLPQFDKGDNKFSIQDGEFLIHLFSAKNVLFVIA